MQTIKLDVSDTIYDKVMFFLQSFPKKDIKLYDEKSVAKNKQQEKLTDFFHNSPLQGISLERDDEIYQSRVDF